MYRQRRFYLGMLILVVAVVAVLALACGSSATATPQPTAVPQATASPVPTKAPVPVATAAPQPVYGGTLRYAIKFDANSMDPAFTLGEPSTLVSYLIFNQIVRLGTQMDIQPELAESWDVSADGKKVTFHLRTGIKFTDGTNFNATAAKWNLDRCLSADVPCVSKTKINTISSVVALDDATLVINLKNPYRPILAALAEFAGFMVSPTAVEKHKSYSNPTGDFGAKPVGTGAFTFDEWLSQQRITVSKNPNYWDKGKPYLDKIIFQSIPAGETALAMLRTGNSDVMSEATADNRNLVKDNLALKVDRFESGRVYHLLLNVNKPPFDNKALRQAMHYAYDRNTMIKTFYEGEGRPAFAVLGDGWAYDPTVKMYDYDLAKAKAKLAEAALPAGTTVPMFCRTNASDLTICEAVQAMMKAAGINVVLDQVSPADFTPRRAKGEFGFYYSYRTPLGDPHLFISEMYQAGGRGNYAKYSNAQVNTVMDQAAQEFDVAKAKALYTQMQKLILEDSPTVYSMYSVEYVILNAKIKNFKRTPDLDVKLRDLWLEK